jgi:hypothetical protein
MASSTVVVYALVKAPEALNVTVRREPGSWLDATTLTGAAYPEQVVATHTFEEQGLEPPTPGRVPSFPAHALAVESSTDVPTCRPMRLVR